MKEKRQGSNLKYVSFVIFLLALACILTVWVLKKSRKDTGQTASVASSLSGNLSSDESEVGQTEQDGPVIRFFDKNINGDTFDDPVAEKIMEETGVRVEMVSASDNPEEKLEAMLMDDSYPDVILMEQGEMVNRYIEEDVFIPLDDLIEEYGDNISQMYGDILEESRYDDGNIYWLANWYGKDTDASAGVLMRKDYLTELVGEERANSDEPFTLTEYTNLLREFKKRYQTIDGKDSIALSLDDDQQNYEASLWGMFGMKTYGLDQEGKLSYLPATERYEEALLYMNELYRDGLLSKQWIIDKTEKWEEDLKSGRVFSTWACYWDTDEVNEVLEREYGEGSGFYTYKVVADDMTAEETTYNGRNSLGWDAIGITKDCQDPEAAIKLLDYLASEEGQYLTLWGVEGVTWDMEDGKHVPREDFLDQWSQDSQGTQKESGVRQWKWCIKNGNGSDDTPYDLTSKYIPSKYCEFANERFADTDYWDKAEYIGLEPGAKSDLGYRWQQIEDLYKQNYGQIICASSQEEAVSLYEKMVYEMESAGLEKCEKYINNLYQSRKEAE